MCRTLQGTVICRRICGDLPKNKVPDESRIVATISKGTYARYDKFESFDKGGYYRVCYRTKNWANSTPNNGEDRTFTFEVPYK